MLTDHTFAPFLPSLSLPLSDSYSSTVTIRISLPLPLQKDIPPRFPPPAPPVFSANSNFNVHPRQISEPIQLEAYRPYYVEVYHKEGTEADYVNVNVRIVCVCVRVCVRVYGYCCTLCLPFGPSPLPAPLPSGKCLMQPI